MATYIISAKDSSLGDCDSLKHGDAEYLATLQTFILTRVVQKNVDYIDNVGME